MATALASELTGRPVRGDIAMTGEITLSGRVLPVGGIKEKVLAARRLGIHEVILPKQNEKNVNEDLTEELRRELTVHYVIHIRRGPRPRAVEPHTASWDDSHRSTTEVSDQDARWHSLAGPRAGGTRAAVVAWRWWTDFRL